MKPVTEVIFHANCLDGATCEGLLRRVHPKATFVGIAPDRVLDALKQSAGHVLLVDVAPNRVQIAAIEAELRRIRAGGGSVQWFDHHAPQWVGCEAIEDQGNFTVDRSGTVSAAPLILEYMMRQGMVASADDVNMVQAVSGRDTWQDDGQGFGLQLALHQRHFGRQYVHQVQEGAWREIIEESEALLDRHLDQVSRAVSRSTALRPGVMLCTQPGPSSDIAARLFSDPRVHTVIHSANPGLVSIRTKPGFPASQTLAERIGGGGHENASGARMWGQRVPVPIWRAVVRYHPIVQGMARHAAQLME